MKNILFTFIFAFSLFLFATQVNAVTPSGKTITVPVPVVAVTKIDYTLPYPGLLPDSSLYFVKQIRDKALEYLITDPVRKIEFYLLQSDKRLAMGMALMEKGSAALEETTVSKGEKYMGLAVALLAKTKSTGMPVPAEVVDRLSTAIGKHIEVLNDLIAKASGSVKSGLEGSLTLLTDLQQQVAKLK